MRLEFNDEDVSNEINNKVKLLKKFPFQIDNKTFNSTSSSFRVYLYKPGQYFKPHRDGTEKKEYLESKITCLIYLNDTNEGQTILMPKGFAHKESHISISPKKGNMLLFEHKLWHEGLPLVFGEKYVLRTNLMYL